MPTSPRQDTPSVTPPCRYVSWRAPTGLWIRHVRLDEHMEMMPRAVCLPAASPRRPVAPPAAGRSVSSR